MKVKDLFMENIGSFDNFKNIVNQKKYGLALK